jgi:hypothetical protein
MEMNKDKYTEKGTKKRTTGREEQIREEMWKGK